MRRSSRGDALWKSIKKQSDARKAAGVVTPGLALFGRVFVEQNQYLVECGRIMSAATFCPIVKKKERR